MELIARFYRVFRWFLLAATLLMLFLLLRPDAPPQVQQDVEAPERLEEKMVRAERDAARGAPAELRLDEAELNTWMQRNLAIAPPEPAPPRQQPSSGEPTLEEVQSNVRDIKVKIEGDQIRGWVFFDMYGKEMSLTLQGRLMVQDGYLRLAPTAMKVGSLPIPRSTIERACRRLFESPENREQFRLPPSIRDIRVEGGTLVVSY